MQEVFVHYYHIILTYSVTNLTVEPQDIAIPTSMIANNAAGRPVITFYVQLSSMSFLAASDLSMAIQV